MYVRKMFGSRYDNDGYFNSLCIFIQKSLLCAASQAHLGIVTTIGSKADPLTAQHQCWDLPYSGFVGESESEEFDPFMMRLEDEEEVLESESEESDPFM
eukprot:1068009_1